MDCFVDVEEMVEYIWQMGTNRALPVAQASAHRKDIRKALHTEHD